MDLTYMNSKKEDVGVLQNFTFDLAYGLDENNFELTTSITNHACQAGWYVYLEGTEYGGKITRIRVDTESDRLTYCGDTWHGILEHKILEPDAGEDYLTVSGEANIVLNSLIARMGLESLFKAAPYDSGITISNHQFWRYVAGYTGIKEMLLSAGAKLKMSFEEGFVVLSAEKIVDYSKDDEFDSDQINFVVEKDYLPLNHLICLGQGDLAERTVLHLYCDADGNISETQTLFGADEIEAVYENTNSGDLAELKTEGIKTFKEIRNANESADLTLDPTQTYDILDIVGARENVTGIFMAKQIIKKIVTIKDNETKIEYKVGEE